MKSFLKYLLASFVGVFLAIIVIVLIGMGSASALLSSKSNEVKIKPHTVLDLNLKVQVTDRTIESPLNVVNFQTMEMSGTLGLFDILQNLEKAATDPNIEGLLIQPAMMTPGIATLQEIRAAILKFKESGKFVIAYGDFFTQSGYYLASVADKIYINPEGVIEFRGLRSEIMFYTETLKKIGVEVQVMRHGKFKSAVEPFLTTSMSESSKKQTKAYLDAIWGEMLSDIAESRDLSIDQLNTLADKFAIRTPETALENNFVDGLLYLDQIQDELKNLSGFSSTDKVRSVSMMNYLNAPRTVKRDFTSDRIAVIYGSGTIGINDNGPNSIGGHHLAKAIRKARTNSKIKAIVFRVNSPGGNVLASDIIRREVELAAAEKPLVVSMGDLAASGGYWVSTPAHRIFANTTTLTGSIGVFGLWPNARELVTDKFGIHFDGVQTNELAGMGSIFRPLKPQERDIIQAQIENTYQKFLQKVATDRDMTVSDVAKIGEGRVWSGKDAASIGLIDEFGGLEMAIQWAASEAGIENYRIREMPQLKDPIEEIINQILGRPAQMSKIIESEFPLIRDLKETVNGGPIQARLPYTMTIR
ncbi:MAG: signal peptide peptidase SppA [Bacteroidales bacterium]|nr:signal peptide peptidase SppA [Bacteroidales bacterium]